MGRPRASKPTDAELEILRIVWRRDEVTVRDVHDAFHADARRSSYSALATTMRTMVDKGIIRLTDARRPQKFAAVASQQNTCTSIAEDVTRRVFGGSLANLVRSALSGRRHSATEIADLRALLAQFDSDPPNPSNHSAASKPPDDPAPR